MEAVVFTYLLSSIQAWPQKQKWQQCNSYTKFSDIHWVFILLECTLKWNLEKGMLRMYDTVLDIVISIYGLPKNLSLL